MLRTLTIILTSLLFALSSFAQEDDSECKSLKAALTEFSEVENWKEATAHLIKAEAICEDFGKDNYERLLTCVQNVMAGEPDTSDSYYAYLDTLLMVWQKAEDKGYYDEKKGDFMRGYHHTLLKEPNYQLADFYMSRALIHHEAEVEDEVYLLLYYYNLYNRWYVEEHPPRKEMLKQRYLSDYIMLCNRIKQNDYSPETRETLTEYFALIRPTCKDLTEKAPRFMETLSSDPKQKKKELIQFGQLFIDLGCDSTDGYNTIADSIREYTPGFLPGPFVPTNLAERILVYKELLKNTTDSTEANELRYQIASTYVKMGFFSRAYATAREVSGESKGKALQVQASCVAAMANACGESTLQRKCNYTYAVILLKEAQLHGVDVSSKITTYRNLAPLVDSAVSSTDYQITLDCWGITVDYVREEIVSKGNK